MVMLAFYIGLRVGGNNEVVRPKDSVSEETFSPPVKSEVNVSQNGELKTYSFTEAGNHIGEYAKITGEVLRVYVSKGGTTFVDFCKDYKTCPFTAVIFTSAVKEFEDLKGYKGPITISGTIRSYQGKAQIILDDREQVEIP